MDNNVKEFLSELAKLTQKYGIEIYGCGCCSAVLDLKTQKTILNMLNYDEESQEYNGW